MIHIHDVQKLTGVTVRTLRYYDSIDVLKPASRTEGGHRLYTNEEIKKLQQIQFLQNIGFQLQEIKAMLASDDWNWLESLKKADGLCIKRTKTFTRKRTIIKRTH